MISTRFNLTGDSGVNAALTLTKTGVAGKRYFVTGYSVVISGAAAVNDISILLVDGSTTIWKDWIGTAAPRGTKATHQFADPIAMTKGADAKLVCIAGGAGVVLTLNLRGYEQEF